MNGITKHLDEVRINVCNVQRAHRIASTAWQHHQLYHVVIIIKHNNTKWQRNQFTFADANENKSEKYTRSSVIITKHILQQCVCVCAMHSSRCAAKVVGEIWRGRLISVYAAQCVVTMACKETNEMNNYYVVVRSNLQYLHVNRCFFCMQVWMRVHFLIVFFSLLKTIRCIRSCLLLNISSINFLIQRKL